MRKILKRMMICALIAAVCWCAALLRDRKVLHEDLIRFHVVANSDSREDQARKLKVRDAVLQSIGQDLAKVGDVDQAKAYLQENLPKIQQLAEKTLRELGESGGAVVTLCTEAFDVRHYDTFSLPAGVYESLRIVIGEGKGKNWWCVSFPALCLPATGSGFAEQAVGAGFSEPLVRTLAGDGDYEIRFFLLDQLGKLENILFAG